MPEKMSKFERISFEDKLCQFSFSTCRKSNGTNNKLLNASREISFDPQQEFQKLYSIKGQHRGSQKNVELD